MISSRELIHLIEAFKNQDQSKIDQVIRGLIITAEEKNQYNLAKRLREIYSAVLKDANKDSSTFHASSLANPNTNDSRLFEIRKSKLGLDDIVMSDSNRDVLVEIINNYKKRGVLQKHGLSNDSRVLLYGPPGTGKTLCAYVLAKELNIPIYHVFLDSLISSYLGETGKNLKIIFEEASRHECVLLLDEFDAIAKQRDDTQELGELKRVVTVLLQNIDALNPRTVLVAATNHQHLLDPAVWRRFDYILHMNVLDTSARKALIRMSLPSSEGIDIDLLAQLADGLSGAIIKQVIHRARRRTILDKNSELLVNLISGFLSTSTDSQSKNKEKNLAIKKAIKYLRTSDAHRYTFDELARMTGIPSSTLHYLTK
jgi:SpoVK/Ycf46/Vps4 family AAA+-type ATPase